MRTVLLVVMMSFALAMGDQAFGETSFPGTEEIAGASLVLNGTGTRTKFFMSMYEAALYLLKKESSASTIIAADEPMAMRLRITSSLITKEKMQEATSEGFLKSTGGQTAPIQQEIEAFIEVFNAGIEKGDVYEFVYAPGSGVHVSRNGAPAASIEGLPFKAALFGIWLSDNPVQDDLKKGLLRGGG